MPGSVLFGRPDDRRLWRCARKIERAKAMQRQTSSTDGEAHRAVHSRSPWRGVKVGVRSAADSACPSPASREFGRRGNRQHIREAAGADGLRSAQ